MSPWWLVALVLFLACIAFFPDQTEELLNAVGPPVALALGILAVLGFVVWWISTFLGLFGF